MIGLPFRLLYLAHLAQATSNHTTNSSCPPLDGASRSIWSILGSCALTLLICVWHTIHFNIYEDQGKAFAERTLLVLLSFFAPEGVIWIASKQWWNACDKVLQFRGMLSSALDTFFSFDQ